MLGNEAHKGILAEDYERHRELAEKARERGDAETAAGHYRSCAELLEDIAGLESSDRLARERRDLAKNLRKVAHALSGRGTQRENARDVSGRDGAVGATRGEVDDTADGANARREREREDSEPARADRYLEQPPELDFDDVGGMTELKQTLIDTVVDPLERPELYEEYDLGVVNGILLYGPPGTGKTYITRALAGKLGYNFLDVTPSDLTSSLVGEAADNVAELFAVARANQPCLVFIDEIDAVAGSRSGGAQKTQSERQMVNQLLEELSATQDEDVVVVGATNLIEAVDDAIKRSGRFDERIEVPPPDATAREAILRVHLRDRPVLADEIDWHAVRERTEGYSASDMELVATTAARLALQEAREREEIRPVTQEHVEAAIEETDSSLEGWTG